MFIIVSCQFKLAKRFIDLSAVPIEGRQGFNGQMLCSLYQMGSMLKGYTQCIELARLLTCLLSVVQYLFPLASHIVMVSQVCHMVFQCMGVDLLYCLCHSAM